MSQITIASIILVLAVIMFFTSKIPNSVAAILCTIAMGISGILPVKTVFNYYASSSIILMIGMMVVGGGMMHTGFAGWLGNKIVHMTGSGERNLVLIAVLAGWFMSSVASGSASLMILYPILCSICIASHISMSKIMMPMFSGIGFGSLMTVAGSGMCGATSAILQEAGFNGWSFFEPAWMGLPIAIVGTAIIYFFYNKLLPNKMVMPSAAEAEKAHNIPTQFSSKMAISAVILVSTIIGMVVNNPIMPMYMCAALGGALSVVTGCLNQKQMFSSISWSTIFMIGGMTAVAKGVEASGLGEVIATSIMGVVGDNASPVLMVAVILIVTGIITQFMSNNAAASLMAPIGISLAATMGVEPYAFVAAALAGSLLAMLTPIATPTMAFAMEGGEYDPKTVFKWGLFTQLIPNTIICIVIISLVWL
ncbi:MAG: SLC13 family permease [Angelakisella sp.]|nr:SLC13 family permease [Angelakisella sp.]